MKRNNFFILFILIFFLISNISVANIKNDIVLKVGNQIITEYDIKNKILTTLFLNKKEFIQKNIDELKIVSLELLVLNKLKKIELSKYNIQSDQKQILEFLDILRSLEENLQRLVFQLIAYHTPFHPQIHLRMIFL